MKYLFIIDTNSYAGNFEREMCAYLTDQIGECGIGKEFCENNELSEEFEKIILQEPDEEGCIRPVTIEIPNILKHQSVGIYFGEKPSERQISYMIQRAKEFNKILREKHHWGVYDIKILGFRLGCLVTTYKEEIIK